nr:hypothetical protein [Tanacetum cinerariifolium]
ARSWSISTVNPYEEAARPVLEQELPPLSPAHIAEADPEEDPEQDLEEDHADHPTDRGDNGDEPFKDDTDDEDEEEAFGEEDDDEEEEHLAPADSSTILTVDHVPSAEDTEAFQKDESAPTPIPSSIRHKARMSILSPPFPLPLPPTHTSPTYDEAPLGYKGAEIRLKAASPIPLPAPSSLLPLPATSHREDVPKADVPPRKRLCLTAPTSRFKIRESSVDVATRQPGSSMECRVDYGFVDTVDVNVRRRDSKEFYTRHQDAYDDRAAVRVKIEDANDHATRSMMHIHVLEQRAHIDTLEDTGTKNSASTTTTSMTDAQIKAIITQGVADALGEIEANQNKNGDDCHD